MLTARLKKGAPSWTRFESGVMRAEIPVKCGKTTCSGHFGAMSIWASLVNVGPWKRAYELHAQFDSASGFFPSHYDKTTGEWWELGPIRGTPAALPSLRTVWRKPLERPRRNLKVTSDGVLYAYSELPAEDAIWTFSKHAEERQARGLKPLGHRPFMQLGVLRLPATFRCPRCKWLNTVPDLAEEAIAQSVESLSRYCNMKPPATLRWEGDPGSGWVLYYLVTGIDTPLEQ